DPNGPQPPAAVGAVGGVGWHDPESSTGVGVASDTPVEDSGSCHPTGGPGIGRLRGRERPARATPAVPPRAVAVPNAGHGPATGAADCPDPPDSGLNRLVPGKSQKSANNRCTSAVYDATIARVSLCQLCPT